MSEASPSDPQDAGRAGRAPSAVGDTVDLLANRWTVVVVTALEQSRRPFSELRESTGMSAQLLSKTLKRLEDSGLLARTASASTPSRVEYELTELGATAWPIVRAINDWATAHGDAVARARRDAEH